DLPDARRGEVVEDRRAEPAGAHDEHPGRPQPPLAKVAELLEEQVTRVPQNLVAAQRRAGVAQRGQGHALTVGARPRPWVAERPTCGPRPWSGPHGRER